MATIGICYTPLAAFESATCAIILACQSYPSMLSALDSTRYIFKQRGRF